MFDVNQPIFRRLSLAIFLAVGVTSLPAEADAKKIRIKLGTLAPRGSKWFQSLDKMGRRWKQASKGQVQLKIYPGGIAGDEDDVIRKMRIGQLHAATLTNIGLGSIDRSTIGLQIPMMFRSYEELDYVRDRIGPKLASELEKRGFVVLDWGDAGWVHFFSKQKAITPEEFRKQKLYVWSGDPQSEAAWRAGGFNVVPTANSDVLQGLQTGRLESFAIVPLYALASQWFALAPNMLALKWAPLSGATVVSKQLWAKLDPELQAQLKTITVEESRASREEIRGLGHEALKAMVDRGLKVYDPDEATIKAWRVIAQEAYPAIKGKVVPAPVFEEIQQLLSEYRSSQGT
ncbi:MAG: TRAP transporter substrate-binding protein DctP [Myxococcales bacterium]|nr:TRAP transporter substrate-binding protein DctP [Myxococcales bacterium]